jgi:hypothetical protein
MITGQITHEESWEQIAALLLAHPVQAVTGGVSKFNQSDICPAAANDRRLSAPVGQVPAAVFYRRE